MRIPTIAKPHPFPRAIRDCWKADFAKIDRREYTLQNKYGLTLSRYEKMLEKQGGVCAICKLTPVTSKRLVVDHSHTTGVVRGLLCPRCNSGLGLFRENPGYLKSAIEYVKKHRYKKGKDRARVKKGRYAVGRSSEGF